MAKSIFSKLFPYPLGSRNIAPKQKSTPKNYKTREDLDNELLAKRERVHTKTNKFKNFFGFGEKLSHEEERRLLHIELEKAQKKLNSKSNFDPNRSIFE